MAAPLAGLHIVSMATQLPGPFATMILADLGADVVLVERPGEGDPARQLPAIHAAVSRGSRSVALDLKDVADRQRLLELCRDTDVVFEGFRPGVADRLGVGPSAIREVNEDAVYVSISGFGQTGPYRDRPAHDIVYQAISGALHDQASDTTASGRAPLIPLADLTAGTFAVVGVLTALLERHRGGPARHVDVSITDTLVTLLGPLIASAATGDHVGVPPTPGYGVYWTRDGVPVAFGVFHEDHLWRDLCVAIGRPDLARFPVAQRWSQREHLEDELRHTVADWTWDELRTVLERDGVAFGRVHRLDEVPRDPHLTAHGLFHRGPHGPVVRQPLRFDGVAPQVGDPAVPSVGEHTADLVGDHVPRISSAARR